MEGTQVIGWDAAQGRIRSWLFDSDGGFLESVWTQKGDRWIIESAATLPDGRRGSSVQTITPVDEDSYTWESTGRGVDGEILPNVGPVAVRRAHDAVEDSQAKEQAGDYDAAEHDAADHDAAEHDVDEHGAEDDGAGEETTNEDPGAGEEDTAH